MTDQELLQRYRKTTKPEYLGTLYKRYVHLVYGLCLKYLSNREDAQDAVMDIYERISHILLRDDIQYFKSWLYSVAKNHCLVLLRRHKEMVSIDENFMEIDTYEHHSNDQIDLEECIERLKEEQKKCVKLFFLQKKRYTDISQATAYSLNEVKSHIQNGKRNLKMCLEEKNVEE